MLLLEDSILNVEVVALVILGLSQLSVLDYDTTALVGPPSLIGELLLLLSLSLHTLNHLRLSPLLLNILNEAHLVSDHAHPSSLLVLAALLVERLLGLAPQAD